MSIKKLSLVLSLLAISCVSRAPTNNELDRRAGLSPSLPQGTVRRVDGLAATAGRMKDSDMPVRIVPRLEKVWVYDQEFDGGYWLQGTFVFLQVEESRWVRNGEEEK